MNGLFGLGQVAKRELRLKRMVDDYLLAEKAPLELEHEPTIPAKSVVTLERGGIKGSFDPLTEGHFPSLVAAATKDRS